MSSKFYIIMNKQLGGGSNQYIEDSFPFYEIITKKNELWSIYEKNYTLILQPLIDLEITIDDILQFYKEKKCNIIIPIHEWYWISYKNEKYKHIPKFDCRHNLYLTSLEIIDKVKELFSISTQILCPSIFVFEYIKKFSPKNIIYSPWRDYEIQFNQKPFIFPIQKNIIRIGILYRYTKYKGKEEIEEIRKKIQKIHYNQQIYKIEYLIVGVNIPYYKNTLKDYFSVIEKYKIHGLFHLNRWGETYCYGLTKSLLSGLPILYNNFGSFKERIPKDYKKYQIYHNQEEEYLKINQSSLFHFFIYLIQNQSKTKFLIPYKKEPPMINDYWIKNYNFITIILTTTVFINPYKSMIFQRNSKERIQTYLKSINQWIKKTNFHLIIIENSGYTFPEIKRSPRVEVISFQEKNIPNIEKLYRYHSKGWSEGYSIQYAYKHSKFIKYSNFIFKVTGRYFIPEFENYLSQFKVNNYDIMTQFEKDRCEVLGCHPKHFFTLFHLDYRNENGELDYHVENIYQYRTKQFQKEIPSKKFIIEPTQQGGTNNIISYL